MLNLKLHFLLILKTNNTILIFEKQILISDVMLL